MPVIGMNLGTTNSFAAAWINERCTLIPNASGRYVTPSVVSIDTDGTVLIGSAAKKRLISHPQRTAANFMRCLDTDAGFMLADNAYTPAELVSFIMRSLKQDAEAFLGVPVTEAVISLPACTDENGRSVIKTAGKAAGFHALRIINEPGAAVLAFHQDSDADAASLVIDWGGRTLDVAVVDASAHVIEVVAIAGDKNLGGADLDQAIADYFCQTNGLVMNDLLPQIAASLLQQAEQCKIALSSAESAMMITEIAGKQHVLLLNRQDLADICMPFMQRVESVIARVLRDCQNTCEVDEVLLTGGLGQMPSVQQYMLHLLGKPPLFRFSHAAAVLGAGYAARKTPHTQHDIPDICPFSLGIGVINHDNSANTLFSPILERNTILPASRMRSYFTTQNNQSKMLIGIYQGDDMYCANNRKLGEIAIEVPRASRGTQGVDVRLTYAVDGILQVEVTCQSTGLQEQMLYVHPQLELSADELRARLAALEECKLPPREDEENKILLAWAARLYHESTGMLRAQIHEQVDYFHLLLHEGIGSKLRRYRKEFAYFLDQIDDHLGSDEDVLRAFRESYDIEPYDEDVEP